MQKRIIYLSCKPLTLNSGYTVESTPKSRFFEIAGKDAKFYFGSMYSVQLLSLLRKVQFAGN